MRSAVMTALVIACTTSVTALAQDANLEPEFGPINLNASYRIEAYNEFILAGGPLHARDTVGCPGYIKAAPHLSVDAQAGYARIGATANDSRDELTLIILGPQGWSCTDDRMGGGTEMIFENAPAGRYHVWVGTYGPNGNIAAYVYADDEPENMGWR